MCSRWCTDCKLDSWSQPLTPKTTRSLFTVIIHNRFCFDSIFPQTELVVCLKARLCISSQNTHKKTLSETIHRSWRKNMQDDWIYNTTDLSAQWNKVFEYKLGVKTLCRRRERSFKSGSRLIWWKQTQKTKFFFFQCFFSRFECFLKVNLKTIFHPFWSVVRKLWR